MKLAQLFENQSVFSTMLLKLVRAGQPVFLKAKNRTVMVGNVSWNAKTGSVSSTEPLRGELQGWVVQHDYRFYSDPSKRPSSVEYVQRQLDDNRLSLSSYKEFAMEGTGTHHSMSFNFEEPVDEHYTIKKIDGVWTIIDREPVNEEQMNDEEFMLKMALRLAKKHGHEGKMSEKDALEFDYAGFKVLVFYLPEKNSSHPWAVGWYMNGKLANKKLSRFANARAALADIFGDVMLKEMSADMEADDQQFAMKMLEKKLKSLHIEFDKTAANRLVVMLRDGLLAITYVRNLAGNYVWRISKVQDGKLQHVEFRDTPREVIADIQAELARSGNGADTK